MCTACLSLITSQNLAAMFTRVNAVNSQQPASSPRLFPRAALAVTGASDNAPVKLDMDSIITMAEAQGQRTTWAETTPGSILLLPHGQSIGAVADIMGAT